LTLPWFQSKDSFGSKTKIHALLECKALWVKDLTPRKTLKALEKSENQADLKDFKLTFEDTESYSEF